MTNKLININREVELGGETYLFISFGFSLPASTFKAMVNQITDEVSNEKCFFWHEDLKTWVVRQDYAGMVEDITKSYYERSSLKDLDELKRKLYEVVQSEQPQE